MAKKRNVYKINGTRVPGVTSITGILDKPALLYWAINKALEHIGSHWKCSGTYTDEEIQIVLQDAKNAHRAKKEEAGDIGSNIHEIVESYIGGQLMSEDIKDPYERKALENFIKVTKGWKWHGAEIVVLNEDHMYGGTADGLAALPDGTIVITDVKTGSGVYPEHDVQITMYKEATPTDERLRKLWSEIKEGRILHFNKERCTWEVLERDIHVHVPFIPFFRGCYEWRRQFCDK